MPMMHRRYALQDRCLELVCDWEAAVEWVDRSLLPFVVIADAPRQVATITCHYDSRADFPPATPMTTAPIHCGRQAQEYTATTGERCFVGSDDTQYVVDGCHIDAHYPQRDHESLRDPARLCREILYNTLPSGSWFELHASAVARGGRAVAFAGPKGSGKTTLLCRLLSERPVMPTFDFVSNDRIWLEVESQGSMRQGILGSPMPVLVGYGTMASIPELATQLAMYRDGFDVLVKNWSRKCHEYVAQEIADLFGCQITSRAELVALIVLKTGESNLLTVVDDDRKREVLGRAAREQNYPNWMNIGTASSERVIDDRALRCPMYEMEFNPSAGAITKCDDSIINVLGNLLV